MNCDKVSLSELKNNEVKSLSCSTLPPRFRGEIDQYSRNPGKSRKCTSQYHYYNLSIEQVQDCETDLHLKVRNYYSKLQTFAQTFATSSRSPNLMHDGL